MGENGFDWNELIGVAIAVGFFVFLVVGLPMLKERRQGLAVVSNISAYQMPWMVRVSQPTTKPRHKKVMSTQQKKMVVKRHRSRLKQRKARSHTAYQQSIPAVHTSPSKPQIDTPQLDIKTNELTDKQKPIVKQMLLDGYSANEIFTLLRGDRPTRLAQIKAIREEIEEEKEVAAAIALAKQIAQPDTDVPPMEPPILEPPTKKFEFEPLELKDAA